MNWFNRLVNSFRSDKQTRNIAGSDTWLAGGGTAGVPVTHDSALTLTAVYACVNVIASSIASMPYLVYRRGPGGIKEPDPSYHLYDLLQFEPNPETDAYSFWTDLVGQSVLTGNGYAEIVRDDAGYPEALWILDTASTHAKRDETGRLCYQVQSRASGERIQHSYLLAEDVLHIRTISGNGNGIVGSSPIMLAQTLISTALAAQVSAASVFRNSSLPLGFLTTPGVLEDDLARRNLREYFNREHQNAFNHGKIGILEEGTKFEPIKLDLESLQYSESQLTHAKMIAQLFGVPAHKIGILSEATYSNIEEMDLDFYKSTLRLWCERIESQVNTKLFSKQDRKLWMAEHNMNAVVRGNLASQTDHLVKAFGVGAYSVNQVCQSIGINPIGPDGDQRYVLNNFVPLGRPEGSVNPDALPEYPDLGDNPPDGSVRAVEPRATPEALAALRGLLRAEIGRLCHREQLAVGRLTKRQAPQSDLDDYYQGHGQIAIEALGPVVTAYRAVGGQVDLLGLVADLISQAEDLTAKESEITGRFKEDK